MTKVVEEQGKSYIGQLLTALDHSKKSLDRVFKVVFVEEMLPKDLKIVMERFNNIKHSPSLAKLVCLLESKNIYLSTGLDVFAAQGTLRK